MPGRSAGSSGCCEEGGRTRFPSALSRTRSSWETAAPEIAGIPAGKGVGVESTWSGAYPGRDLRRVAA